jgi:SlyX protein
MSESDRLEAVEIKLAHLERALNEINEVVILQQRQLDQARARQQELLQQLESLEAQAGGASAGGFEKPPHY